MAYEKRLCVLKQIKKGFSADGSALSGAVYLERLGTELVLSPRMTGAAPVKEGRYAFVVKIDGEAFCLEAKGNEPLRIPSAPSLKNGFSVLFCFVKKAGEPEPVAFGYTGLGEKNYSLLLSVFDTPEAGKKKKTVPVIPLSPFEQPSPTNPQAPKAPAPMVPTSPEEDEEPFRDCLAAEYNDEAITDTNYFLSSGGEDEVADLGGEAEKKENGQEACGHAEDGDLLLRLNRGGLTYYNEVREKLEEAMKSERDTRLNATFPNSEWVKAKGGLLGIVYADGLPRYLCVAVEKEQALPPEVAEKAMFVPLSEFSETEGLFVVFQDADTGEYVTVSSS